MELLIAIFLVIGVVTVLELISIHGSLTRNNAMIADQREAITRLQDIVMPIELPRRTRH